jgi:GNAT superfamily N-acetyltransferase
MARGWDDVPIARHHNRRGFDCGNAALNDYLLRYARQNHESGSAKTFVAVRPESPERVLGYYSLTPGAIQFPRVPPGLFRGHGRYDLPVFRLARVAVEIGEQGRGLGGALLLAAAARAIAVASLGGGIALAIDAKNGRAVVWYTTFGAVRLLDDPLKLVLPFATVAGAAKRAAGP